MTLSILDEVHTISYHPYHIEVVNQHRVIAVVFVLIIGIAFLILDWIILDQQYSLIWIIIIINLIRFKIIIVTMISIAMIMISIVMIIIIVIIDLKHS